MAVRTSSQAGPWATSATWGGSAAPGAGDSAVIGHAVTVGSNVTVGENRPSIPIGQPTVAVTGGGASGGLLQAATYRAFITDVNANGESSAGLETGSFTPTLGNIPRITLAARPTGVVSRNLYIGSTGAETLYATGITGTTYDMATATVGGQPSAPVAGAGGIRVNGTSGSLTVQDGFTLTVRGDTGLNNATLTLDAGGSFAFDSSQASSPFDTNYRIVRGTANSQTTAKIAFNGTSSKRCSISSNASGGNGLITSSLLVTGTGSQVENHGNDVSTYTTWTRVGTAALPSLGFNHSTTSRSITIGNNLFLECGDVRGYGNLPLSCSFDITNTTFRGSVGTYNVQVGRTPGTQTGTRNCTGNVFDKECRYPSVSATFDDTIFLGSFAYPQNGADKHTSWQRTFLRHTNFNPVSRAGDWSQTYMIIDGSTLTATGTYSATAEVTNPHWTNPVGPNGTYIVTQCIIEDFGSSAGGDWDYGPNSASINTQMTYNIGLPGPGAVSGTHAGVPDNPGTITTLNGWSGAASVYEHNTWFAGNQGCVAMAEGSSGFAGMLSSYKSNVVWSSTYWQALNGTGGLIGPYHAYDVFFTTLDLIAGGGTAADYNVGYKLRTGSKGKGYDLNLTNSPGAHDLFGNDPQFVDETRRFWTWTRDILCSGTHPLTGSPTRYDWNAYGLYLIGLRNETSHADYKANATLSNLMTYIRAGFAPTNATLQNAGHDGVTIGAVEYTTLGGGPKIFHNHFMSQGIV